MKKECKVIYEDTEEGTYLTFVSDERVLTLEFGDLSQISVEDIHDAFEACGSDAE